MSPADDEALPDTAQAGSLSPFDKYVVPEIPVLYRVGLALTHQHADAEDLVQETLVAYVVGRVMVRRAHCGGNPAREGDASIRTQRERNRSHAPAGCTSDGCHLDVWYQVRPSQGEPWWEDAVRERPHRLGADMTDTSTAEILFDPSDTSG